MAVRAKEKTSGGVAEARLRSYIERIERLDDERRVISEDIKDVKTEAKSAGFDTKVINQMLRERRMSDAEREEHMALAELYRAALGMLNGTPLGDAARRRFEPPAPSAPAAPPPAKGAGSAPASAPAPATLDPGDPSPPIPDPDPDPEPDADPAAPTPAEIAAAKAEGGECALAGLPVIRNPWPATDPRRASWDEGWCGQAGNDGMEIPQAWRRRPRAPAPAQPAAPQ